MNTEIQTVNDSAPIAGIDRFAKQIDAIATAEIQLAKYTGAKVTGIQKGLREIMVGSATRQDAANCLSAIMVRIIKARAEETKTKESDIKSSDPAIKNLRAHFQQVSRKIAKTDETTAKRLLPEPSNGITSDAAWTVITDKETGQLVVGAKKAHTRGTKAEPMVHIGPETRTAKAVAASDEIIRLVHDLCVLVENVKDATEQKSIRSRISNSLSAQWHNLVALREMKPTKLPTTVEGETTDD